MKKVNPYYQFFIVLVLMLCSFGSFAQPYYNNWINYSQQYYKFKISTTGLYRLDAATLNNAGIPLSSIDPRNIQIFGRGQEIPLYIEGENDGVFDATDFIEFYAQHNDGWFEEDFYGGASNHPNPYYSLINDTATYFITWNNSTTNSRVILENDTNYLSYTPKDFFTKEVIENYHSSYFTGKTLVIGGTSENLFGYDPTEGWFDNAFAIGATKTKTILTPNIYNNGASAKFSTVVLGASNYGAVVNDHHLKVQIGLQTIDTIYEGYEKIDLTIDVPINEINFASNSIVFQSINDLGSAVDRQTVAYVKLKYPHTTNLEGVSLFDNFYVDDDLTQPKSYYQFSNLLGSGNVVCYDLTNQKRIKVTQNGGVYNCLIPNSGNEKKCVIGFSSEMDTVTVIEPVNGSGFFTDYNLLNPDTAFVIITHPTLLNEANNYANYRLTNFNNPENAVVFNIEELYDQFAYGIKQHPYAIRGFIDFILDNWTSTPKNLFFIGKSVKVNEARASSLNYQKNLVPSFGHPASDMMLTAGLNGTIHQSPIPMGRIAAQTETEVQWYLNKIIDYENPIPNPLSSPNGEVDWMKKALHFAGGQSVSDATQFMGFLNGYKNTLEDTLFGGDVYSFAKSTSAPIQISMTDSINQFISNGVALMTFFGHASATGGFDQNIDDAANWPEQNGKYPFLLGNACLAGDIHLPSANSISEEYVLIEDKGVIGFLASVDFGVTNYLNTYSSEFYKNLSYKNYGGSVGKHIKNTIEYVQGSGSNTLMNSTVLGMTLHGDPSVVINTFPKPDYMVNQSSVYFTPSVVTSDLDSFDVNIIIANLGRATNTNIIVELTRMFPNSAFNDTVYLKTIPSVDYKDTITFTLPVDVVRGLGTNTFSVYVDALNQVDEIHETNNQTMVQLDILSGEIIPIFPYRYAIVPNQNITLTASTALPFEPAKDYIFEVDTTDYFNSPIKQSITINQSGGIISWSPSLLQNMTDSTVYFWRVGKDSVDATGYSWRNMSFQYIKNKTGWGQAHFFQFEPDEFQFLKHNRSTRRFEFVPNIKELKVTTKVAANLSEFWDIGYKIDGFTIGNNGWLASSSIHVAVMDSLSIDYWRSDEKDFGQANFGNTKPGFFIFRQNDPVQMAALANMLNDSIPDNNYVAIWSFYVNSFPGYATLPNNVRTAFQNLGAINLPAIQDSLAFILFVQKGNPASAIEIIADSTEQDYMTLNKTITTTANYANIYSEIFGPATSWDSLSWQVNNLEFPSKDSSILNVYGIDAGGNVSLTPLISNLPTDSTNILINDDVDASLYPYLKLNAYLSDDSLYTAPQLKRWQVTYADIPEAALDPKTYFQFYNDTVQEGENIQLSMAVKNISKVDMDSLLISFSVLDRNNNLHTLPYARQRPLLVDSVIIASIQFSTVGFQGLNKLLIDVNPNNDQLEKYHFNNVAEIPFYVGKDNINPILDVTFDGIHILNGDIVSPKTEIVIELTDENQYLALDDTTDYFVYLTRPNEGEKRIYFNQSGVQKMSFIPASLPKNKAKIIFPGNFPVDGTYKLRVQANDKSKNLSGRLDYIIDFEVINHSSITNILNYPNPFSTATKFVFTLTGSEIPTIFKIQIMTITGKVVREIHKDEFGPIRIGRNISEFTWDGTDTYGDRLANGLYLYRVFTKINSDNIDHRETSADGYFKKELGKMYLFR
ncbi:MAG: hypothetical protein H6587_03400 [Flavobacteriales bacterium]|nr:hypothetical protein [Flavobacteriales bacterium]MCB9363594.1 hypothetical protein [Flavobacteriales bacterium]